MSKNDKIGECQQKFEECHDQNLNDQELNNMKASVIIAALGVQFLTTANPLRQLIDNSCSQCIAQNIALTDIDIEAYWADPAYPYYYACLYQGAYSCCRDLLQSEDPSTQSDACTLGTCTKTFDQSVFDVSTSTTMLMSQYEYFYVSDYLSCPTDDDRTGSIPQCTDALITLTDDSNALQAVYEVEDEDTTDTQGLSNLCTWSAAVTIVNDTMLQDSLFVTDTQYPSIKVLVEWSAGDNSETQIFVVFEHTNQNGDVTKEIDSVMSGSESYMVSPDASISVVASMDLSSTVLVETTFSYIDAVAPVDPDVDVPVVVAEGGLADDELQALIVGSGFLLFILIAIIIIKCCCKRRNLPESIEDSYFLKEMNRITRLGNLEESMNIDEIDQSKQNKSMTATKNQVLPEEDADVQLPQKNDIPEIKKSKSSSSSSSGLSDNKKKVREVTQVNLLGDSPAKTFAEIKKSIDRGHNSKQRSRKDQQIVQENTKGSSVNDDTVLDSRTDNIRHTPGQKSKMRPQSSQPQRPPARGVNPKSSRNHNDDKSFSSDHGQNNLFNKKIENEFDSSHRSGGGDDPYAFNTNAYTVQEEVQEEAEDNEAENRGGVQGMFYNRAQTKTRARDDDDEGDENVMVFSAKKSKRSAFKRRQTHT